MEKRGVALIVLFIGLLVLIPIISAYSLGSSFDSLFTSWQQGDVAPNVAKIVFAILLIFLIYSLLDNVGLFKQKAVLWIISILVSALATLYLAPEEIYGMLVSYSALGLTLGSMIPFLVLFGFTITAIKSGEPGQIMMQWVAWILFGAFMIYRSIMFWFFEGTSGISNTVVAILLGATIACIIMVLANNKIIEIIGKKWVESNVQHAQRTIDLATENVRQQARMQRRLGGSE